MTRNLAFMSMRIKIICRAVEAEEDMDKEEETVVDMVVKVGVGIIPTLNIITMETAVILADNVHTLVAECMVVKVER